jgi:transposase-like protein
MNKKCAFAWLQEIAYETMKEHEPKMLDTVTALVMRGEHPRKIGRFVAHKSGNTNFLPGLVEAAARHIKRQL